MLQANIFRTLARRRAAAYVTSHNKSVRPWVLVFDARVADAKVRVSIAEFTRPLTRIFYAVVDHGSIFEETQAGASFGLALKRGWSPTCILAAIGAQEGWPADYEVFDAQEDVVELHFPRPLETASVRHSKRGEALRISRVNAHVLFADIRGFSNWSLTASDAVLAELFEVISDRVMQFQIDYPFNYWKLLGDGIMIVWEDDLVPGYSGASGALGAAYELHYKYRAWSEEDSSRPKGLGIAVCGGPVVKVESATFFDSCTVRDYLGPVVNQAARLQGIAEAGETYVNAVTARCADPRFYKFRDVSAQLAGRLSTLKGYPGDRAVLAPVWQMPKF